MKKIIITFGLILAVCAIAFAQSDNSNKKILFKAGTEFSAQIDNGLNAEESKIGEDLNFKLTEDFVGDGHTVSKLPVGILVPESYKPTIRLNR